MIYIVIYQYEKILKRKFSLNKIKPHSGIFHIIQGQSKPFYEYQSETIDNDFVDQK